MFSRYFLGGGSVCAVAPADGSFRSFHIDDASNGFMRDPILRRQMTKRFAFGSLLNLRPDIWRKPIPSDRTTDLAKVN
jgi:hypothetical protein